MRPAQRTYVESEIASLRGQLRAPPEEPGTDSSCPWKPEDDKVCFEPVSEIREVSELEQRGVKSVSRGPTHACGVDAEGSVWCLGSNGMGELGDGTREARAHAVKVHRIANAVHVHAGPHRTCAVLRSGHVECWGQGARSGRRPERGAIRLTVLPRGGICRSSFRSTWPRPPSNRGGVVSPFVTPSGGLAPLGKGLVPRVVPWTALRTRARRA